MAFLSDVMAYSLCVHYAAFSWPLTFWLQNRSASYTLQQQLLLSIYDFLELLGIGMDI